MGGAHSLKRKPAQDHDSRIESPDWILQLRDNHFSKSDTCIQVEVTVTQSIAICPQFRRFLLPACQVELYLQHDFSYTTGNIPTWMNSGNWEYMTFQVYSLMYITGEQHLIWMARVLLFGVTAVKANVQWYIFLLLQTYSRSYRCKFE